MNDPRKPCSIEGLGSVIDQLLDPERGCPWDREQTPSSLRSSLVEEAHEASEAIRRGAPDEVLDELADVLFLLVFITRLYERGGGFGFAQVVARAMEKYIGRHPHVFDGNETRLETAEGVKAAWHRLKQAEGGRRGLLSGVPASLPALMRAHRLGERAAKVGFDWSEAKEVLTTVQKELAEVQQAMEQEGPERTSQELGDLFFTLVNFSRHLGHSAEESLQGANDRFTKRFSYIENNAQADGRTLDELELTEMDQLWQEAKEKDG